MPLPLRDIAALLVAVGACVAAIVAWSAGTVSLGMQLSEVDGEVRVADVTPDGNAAWYGWSPGIRILDLATVDGSDVERGEPLPGNVDGTFWPQHASFDVVGELFGTAGGPLVQVDELRPPVDAPHPSRIERAIGGEVFGDPPEVAVYTTLDRTLLELELRSSIWIAAFGAALGVVLWRLLRHGVAGAVGREHAALLGCAAAAPFLVLPVVEVGTTAGIIAGFAVPAAIALIVGLSLARRHPDRSWGQTAAAGALLTAGLAAVLLVRYMTSPALAPADRGGVLLMVAAVAFIPALAVANAAREPLRDRLGLLSLSLVPGAAQTVIGPRPDVLAPTILIGLLVGVQVLPVERALPAIGQRLSSIGADRDPPIASTVGRITPFARDVMALVLLTAIVVPGIAAGQHTWAVIAALASAGVLWYVVRQGFLGPGWSDAAIPLAVAVGVPIALHAFGSPSENGLSWALAPIALGALPVAHVLAGRIPDPVLAGRLLWISAALILPIWLLSVVMGLSVIAIAVVCCIPLVPGIPLAFASSADDASGISTRLETMAVALTPSAAALIVTPVGVVIFAAWLAALIIWRYFTMAPLLRFAQRSQLQRDIAVAAAETERARLAADLHDDALQQLTMLVRTLDERGDRQTADEAREIADKLRAVVGDLRLPILDDLGAGAALEWLVERVEPLAGGPVRLERSDETRPPATVELAVFRVAQEALNNAIKHGRPPIAIRYDVRADGRVTLAVDDAGEGIEASAADEAPREGHFGLVNMQQRAEQIGGLLDVRRWPGGGTRVALEWRPQ